MTKQERRSLRSEIRDALADEVWRSVDVRAHQGIPWAALVDGLAEVVMVVLEKKGGVRDGK